MDDLRFALLIAGLVVVAGVYALARISRRRAAKRAAELNPVTLESQDGYAHDPDWSVSPVSDSTGEAGGTEADIDRLGGVFAPRREASDAEISVDVSILAGLRATYESTMDGTLDGTVDRAVKESIAPEPSVDDGATAPIVHAVAAQPVADAVAAQPVADAVAAQPHADAVAAQIMAVDMSRPLIYLTLVAKQALVSGQVVLDALDAEGFRPGLMQLYYWRSDAEPSVVFGVANMVEPGVLDPSELPDMQTPGLVTFMSVSEDAASPFRIFDTMVAVSRRLARRIDATLCDETRSTLTAQAENHLREKIADVLRQDRIQG